MEGPHDTFPFGGDLFEAETTCVPEHSLGQVASLVGGLSWWSNAEPPVTTPLPQPISTQSAGLLARSRARSARS